MNIDGKVKNKLNNIVLLIRSSFVCGMKKIGDLFL